MYSFTTEMACRYLKSMFFGVSDKDKKDVYETHMYYLDQFLIEHTKLDDEAVTPLSNFIGYYWTFVTKVKGVSWSYGLDGDALMDAIYETARRNHFKVVGPSCGTENTAYRSVFGLKLVYNNLISWNH